MWGSTTTNNGEQTLRILLSFSSNLSKASRASFCCHCSNGNHLIPVGCRNSRAEALQGSNKALTGHSFHCQVAADKQTSALPGISKGNDMFFASSDMWQAVSGVTRTTFPSWTSVYWDCFSETLCWTHWPCVTTVISGGVMYPLPSWWCT